MGLVIKSLAFNAFSPKFQSCGCGGCRRFLSCSVLHITLQSLENVVHRACLRREERGPASSCFSCLTSKWSRCMYFPQPHVKISPFRSVAKSHNSLYEKKTALSLLVFFPLERRTSLCVCCSHWEAQSWQLLLSQRGRESGGDSDDLGILKKDKPGFLPLRGLLVLNSRSLSTLMSDAWDHC